jgi:hypothetical protein
MKRLVALLVINLLLVFKQKVQDNILYNLINNPLTETS